MTKKQFFIIWGLICTAYSAAAVLFLVWYAMETMELFSAPTAAEQLRDGLILAGTLLGLLILLFIARLRGKKRFPDWSAKNTLFLPVLGILSMIAALLMFKAYGKMQTLLRTLTGNG